MFGGATIFGEGVFSMENGSKDVFAQKACPVECLIIDSFIAVIDRKTMTPMKSP